MRGGREGRRKEGERREGEGRGRRRWEGGKEEKETEEGRGEPDGLLFKCFNIKILQACFLKTLKLKT